MAFQSHLDMHADSLSKLNSKLESLKDTKEEDLRVLTRKTADDVKSQVGKAHEAVIALNQQHLKAKTEYEEHIESMQSKYEAL